MADPSRRQWSSQHPKSTFLTVSRLRYSKSMQGISVRREFFTKHDILGRELWDLLYDCDFLQGSFGGRELLKKAAIGGAKDWRLFV